MYEGSGILTLSARRYMDLGEQVGTFEEHEFIGRVLCSDFSGAKSSSLKYV